MGEAAPSNPSPKSYYSMDCEYRAHAAIFLARQEAACDPFSALNLSVDKFHLRQQVNPGTASRQTYATLAAWRQPQCVEGGGEEAPDVGRAAEDETCRQRD